MIYSGIYLAILTIIFLHFIFVQDRYQKLLDVASLSSKITVLIFLYAFFTKDIFILEVFFFYALFNAAEMIFIAYVLTRRDLE